MIVDSGEPVAKFDSEAPAAAAAAAGEQEEKKNICRIHSSTILKNS